MTEKSGRLRAKPIDECGTAPLHIVLVEPEIPPNTGNIARLCAATASVLHLVGRLGFSIDDRAVKRAGLDYWHLVEVRTHLDFEHFLHAFGAVGALHFFSAHASRSHLAPNYAPGDALIFGKESVGLPKEMLAKYNDRVIAIPTLGKVRSLNLANAVSIATYEALRKIGALDATFEDRD